MEEKSTLKILLRMSPPVMLALLIQSIYNVVDSWYVAAYSQAGLTALSIFAPLQILLVALSTGVGCGVNIPLARMDGAGEKAAQRGILKSGLLIELALSAVFAVVGSGLLPAFFAVSSAQEAVRESGVAYGRIIFVFSQGAFVEAWATKVFQARGNMKLPMAAQVVGAVANIILDPLFIWGAGPVPEMGVAGAALATVLGQWLAMAVVLLPLLRRESVDGRASARDALTVLKNGTPSIIMQSLYTVYIVGLNLLLKGFTEDAVTVLGIYYKLQTFFFVPLLGLQQVLVPVLSYQCGAGKYDRAKALLRGAVAFSGTMMAAVTAVFMLWPARLVQIFSSEEQVLTIGGWALRVIALSFVPAALCMMMMVYFQGIDAGRYSVFLAVLRQIVLLVPLAWLLGFAGLRAVWFAYPLTEIIADAFALAMYRRSERFYLH